ncbi:hypothetical protein GBAR_LOCUS16167 [Geodia barretti]|uniref:Uncharacterized protein n=1 Tax=Geodia barretti TaxID=519541 RepID=A0AA35SFP8_GEOBA|nr:hypothetical protein GBAR_LOCUS16167 [Geodia barretti]
MNVPMKAVAIGWAVAMTCGISGILLAKRSVDRQRLEVLREKNRSSYTSR